jgi:hypothetical protein
VGTFQLQAAYRLTLLLILADPHFVQAGGGTKFVERIGMGTDRRWDRRD